MIMKNKAILSILLISAILIVDQIIKIWIKTNMMLGEEFLVFGQEWFRIHFVENNGMAFGIEMLGGSVGKLFLSLFRIVAIVAIGLFLRKLCKEQRSVFLIICVSMVFAGAVGNVIDCIFYGVVFDTSLGHVASFLPEAGGYSTWMQGRVVDMFYFPLIDSYFPEWFPIWGGEHFLFFRPVFNFADASISVGIALLVLFSRNELSNALNSDKEPEKTTNEG